MKSMNVSFEPRPAKSKRKNVILFLGTSAKRYAF